MQSKMSRRRLSALNSLGLKVNTNDIYKKHANLRKSIKIGKLLTKSKTSNLFHPRIFELKFAKMENSISIQFHLIGA